MKELVITLERKNKDTVQNLLNDLLQKYKMEESELISFDGEFSSYFYLTIEKEIGEKIIQQLNKTKDIEGAYFKPKGSPPSN